MASKPDQRDPRTYAILGAAMEVHGELGRGFLEAVYYEALALEFTARDIPFQRQPDVVVAYKGITLPVSYRPDFVCFGTVVVEIKALAQLTTVEYSQVINYLKATGRTLGLLINFGTDRLEWKRFVRSNRSLETDGIDGVESLGESCNTGASNTLED